MISFKSKLASFKISNVQCKSQDFLTTKNSIATLNSTQLALINKLWCCRKDESIQL